MRTLLFFTCAMVAASTLATTSLSADEPNPPRTFVVYAKSVTYTAYYQSYADTDEPQAAFNGRRASKWTQREYEIVDLGDQVDDGIDLTYPRDVDDNTSFTLSYDPKSKVYYDWDYEISWTARQDDGFLFYSLGEAIQTRSQIGRRFELRHYEDDADFVWQDYDDETEEYTPSLYQRGWCAHSEGPVTAVTLPVTTLFPRGQQPVVWIPRRLTISSSYFSRNPQGYFDYDVDLDEEVFIFGKSYEHDTGKGSSTYNATITAWVNGLRGPLVDPVSGDTLQPGSRAYAGLALIAYLKSLRYTNGAEIDLD